MRGNTRRCQAENPLIALSSFLEPALAAKHTKGQITMDEFESLNHTRWDCKYHVVFIPKYRRKVLYGELKRPLGPVFRQLAEQRESRVEEGHLMPDHVHMLLSIPPKYAVSQVVGYIKGKSAIHLARVYGERKRGFVGQSFWARGYFVSTVGRTKPSSGITSEALAILFKANHTRRQVYNAMT